MKQVFDDVIVDYYEFPMLWNSSKANTNKEETRNFLFANVSHFLQSTGLNQAGDSAVRDGSYYNLAYVQLKGSAMNTTELRTAYRQLFSVGYSQTDSSFQ